MREDLTNKHRQPAGRRQDVPYLPSVNPLWDASKRRFTRDGYFQLCVTDPESGIIHRRMEHIVIWERQNRIKVPRGYVVHHKNEDRSDNRVENLVTLPGAVHVEMHGELRRIREVLTPECYRRQRKRILKTYIKEAQWFNPPGRRAER